ncbi:hypothetical protein [Actinoplanes regularis]|uniref:Uncharacterized protein n=1 Tax=Actinoplanes regularis TaxID=52697 RepID=A0A238XJN1_9ACTN|nr:hypothetical protein [Actinoplanes regularis]GIE90484.1 hypothetical protein Are01nite_69640 [Actinoplanes regularis]SNR58544.1 hypothetical protein SAMN06264365_103476 [Actinoplanes regularis]
MNTRPYAVYQRLTAGGTSDDTDDVVPRSDANLWALAAAIAPELYPAGQLDPIEVEDLRAAYDDGRRPRRIDLYRLATLISDRGVNAYVDGAGGGGAVIRVGEQHITLTGERDHAVLAGPGTFHSRYTAYGDRDELCIGPPDDDLTHRPDDPTIRPAPHRFQTLAELADLTAALAHAEADRHTRIAAYLDVLVRTGWEAFWAVLIGALPDIDFTLSGPAEAEHGVTQQRLLHYLRQVLNDTGMRIGVTPPEQQACAVCGAVQAQTCSTPTCHGRVAITTR